MELKIGDEYNNNGQHIIITNIVKNKLLEDKLLIKYCWSDDTLEQDSSMLEDRFNSYLKERF